MNPSDITWRLAQLASLPYQERYVIQGTANEYVLDTELIENVDAVKYLLRKAENRTVLSQAQMTALEELFAFIEERSGDALAVRTREEGAQRILHSEVWKSLRSKASTALRLFGVSIDELSVENIDALSS